MPSGQERLLSDLTQGHHTRSVTALLDAGTLIDARGEAGGTALHWACWKGYADLVKLLIDRGAPLTVLDTEFHATPAGWFHHGTSNSPGRRSPRRSRSPTDCRQCTHGRM